MDAMPKYVESLQPYIENCSRAITYPTLDKVGGGSLTIKGAQWALQVCSGPNSLPLEDILYGAELSAPTEDMAFNVSSFVYESEKRGFWGFRASYLIPPITPTQPTTSLPKDTGYTRLPLSTASNQRYIGEKTYDKETV